MAAAAIALSPAEFEELDCAAARIEVVGDRYPEHLERMTGL